MPDQSEANLSALMDSTEDMIWSVDPDERLIAFNRALEQYCQANFDVRLAAGMRFHDVFPPERAALWSPLYERALDGSKFRTELPLADGRTLELAFNPIVVHGKMTGVSVFGKDITVRKKAESALREAEEKYRTIFDGALEGMYRTSVEGKNLLANAALARMLGYDSPQEVMSGVQDSARQVWVDPAERERYLRLLNENGTILGFECQYKRRDGSTIWVSLNSRRVCGADGRTLYLEGFIEDITERKADAARLTASTEALHASEERYRTAFQTTLDSININRMSDGCFIDCNQAFLDTVEFKSEEIIGRTSLELNIWPDPRDRHAMVDMVRRNSSFRGLEVQLRKKSGEIFWGQMSASAMVIDGVPCILSVTRDISTAKAAENEIRRLAFYDQLTGLPNRRLLLDRLRQTLAASARSGCSQALLLVDLDNFKTLNDTLGHPTGDLLLQQVARRIAVCAHAADTVYRLGGDEFVVMLEDLSEAAPEAAAQATAVGAQILASIGQSYLLEGRECHSAASIGITVIGDRQNSMDEILQQADIALHQAKAAGRNTMRFFSPALQAAINARAALEEDLRQAIKTNQFLLYYQPQVELGRVTGAEALIRWNHPRRGLMPPEEFIPLAEETRLILPLGAWVLEAACAQIASWAVRKETAHLAVAVNISALQFRQPEFVEQVLGAISRAGANPKNLKLELTESVSVENIEDVIAKMTELKSHGLSFSLDDFGIGYSSLAYLKRLPLDQLKIDRAFVRDMLVDATSGAIAQTIISLGRAMGLSVIAEGVESEEQRGFLAGIGCHCFQGYLFSRPLPLEQFEAFQPSADS